MSRVTKILVALMIACSAPMMSGCSFCTVNGMGDTICNPL
jgi:hypothetical protein